MAEMLLINPRSRRKTAKRHTTAKRRRNPIAAKHVHHKRRRNPIGLARVHRRRRNPISLSQSGIMKELQEAFLGGAGAIAIDVLMGQLKGYLPTSMQRTPGSLGIGDAVKMAITIAVGQALAKPTKGMSRKLATGALVVQARDILATFMPSTMTLGFSSAANVIPGTNRVGPLMQRVGAYSQAPAGTNTMFGPNRSPLLEGVRGYMPRGRGGVLLSGARVREGATTYM